MPNSVFTATTETTIGIKDIPAFKSEPNILSLFDSTFLEKNTDYMAGLSNTDMFNNTFKLMFPPSISVEVTRGVGDYTYTKDAGKLEFSLKGKNSETYIFLKFTGEGRISLDSDLLNEVGYPLMKTYFLNQ